MAVKRRRNTAEDRNASAVNLKETVVKLGHAAAAGQNVAGSITGRVIAIFH